MTARLRDQSGFGLVELLIAMTVMAIGIFALVAGFSSGFSAINRAGKTSTAGAIADQRMESYRRGSFSTVSVPSPNPEFPVTGSDGRTYWILHEISLLCVLGGAVSTGPPATCPDSGGVKQRPVKLVTLTVRDGSSTGRILFKESSTFHQSTG